MDGWMAERGRRLAEFFGAEAGREWAAPEASKFELGAEAAQGLAHFNIEWHVIPTAEAVPFDDAYVARLYASAPKDFSEPHEHGPSYRERFAEGHARLQGRVVGVETTRKPHYLPGSRQ